jgi:hypothetical protein
VLCTVLFSFCRKIHWKNIRVIYFFAYLHTWKHKKIGLYFLFQCFHCACSLVITTSYQTVTDWIYTGCISVYPVSRCLEGARGSWQASVTVSHLSCLLTFDTCCLNLMISHYIEIYLLNRYTWHMRHCTYICRFINIIFCALPLCKFETFGSNKKYISSNHFLPKRSQADNVIKFPKRILRTSTTIIIIIIIIIRFLYIRHNNFYLLNIIK